MTDKRITLYLSSADRISGSYSDFILRIPQTIPSVKKVYVNEVSLPLVLYNISETCNRLAFTDSLSNSYDVSVEPGSYSVSEFTSELELKMNSTASPDIFTVSYSTRTFKFTISTVSGPFSIDDIDYSVYSKMGMESGDISNLVGIDHLITGYVITFGTPFHAYIESTALSSSNNLHVSGHYMSSSPVERGKHIILKIPITANTGGVIQNHYLLSDDHTEVGQHSTNALAQKIDIRLRFPNDTEMLVMSDWSLTVIVVHE